MFGRAKAAKKQKEKETASRGPAPSPLPLSGKTLIEEFPHLPLFPSALPPTYEYAAGSRHPTRPSLASDEPSTTGPVELPAISIQRVPTIVTESQESTPPDDFVSFETISAQVAVIIRRLETFRERRPRLLTAQLISIQSCISTWARDRDVRSVDQLESMLDHLPMITRNTMLDVCDKLRQWVKSPERAQLDRTWGLPSQSKTAYFELMIEGYDTLETLRTVCDSLLTIVPFLTNRPLGLLPRVSPERFDTPSAEVAQPPAGLSGNSGEASQTASESSVPKKKLNIQTLYGNCLEALRAVTIMSTDKEPANVIYSRLVVWGCGLFQASNSLDLILEREDVDSVTTFRSHVIGVLADMAVLLDIILRSYDEIVDPEVRKSLHKLQASFGHFKEFGEVAMDEGPDIPEQTEEETNDRLLGSCLLQLAGLIDCLFDILPSIDRLRQVWILDLEKRSRELAARMALIATASIPDLPQQTNPPQRPSLEYESPSYRLNPRLSPLPLPPGPQLPPFQRTSPSDEGSSTGSGYIPSEYVASPPDELDFRGQPNEGEFSGKGKEAVPGIRKPPEQKASPFRRRPKAQAHRDPRQKSLQDIVTMDLELATALRLSLVEMQTQESKEKQQDQEIMAQLKEWDAEIERLKGWSDVFHKSLGSESSEAETKRLYSIFEQLAKIGGTFASSGPGGPTESSFGAKDVEGKLKIAASVMAVSGGQSIDVKLDPTWKSYREALKAFREANDNIENLG